MALEDQKGAYYQDVAITAAIGTGGGGLLSVLNPEGVDLLITNVVVDVTTASTGAGTADLGIAADGTTSADNLLDGIDFNADAVLDSATNKGTNGKTVLRWGATEYLTLTKKTGSAGSEVDLVARVFVRYLRA